MPTSPLHIVCVGAHPDDPESGCGGTLAQYSQLGHTVTLVYLTRGERGVRGVDHEQAGRTRTAECEASCRTLGATPVFVGQVDGATECTSSRIAEVEHLLETLAPDVVFAHWPVDQHVDHQLASVLTTRAVLALPRKTPLFFFEVNPGEQTMHFDPSVFVDITATRAVKQAALSAHVSQKGAWIYATHNEPMERIRGRELGVEAAEAFVPFARSGARVLPGLA